MYCNNKPLCHVEHLLKTLNIFPYKAQLYIWSLNMSINLFNKQMCCQTISEAFVRDYQEV